MLLLEQIHPIALLFTCILIGLMTTGRHLEISKQYSDTAFLSAYNRDLLFKLSIDTLTGLFIWVLFLLAGWISDAFTTVGYVLLTLASAGIIAGYSSPSQKKHALIALMTTAAALVYLLAVGAWGAGLLAVVGLAAGYYQYRAAI